MRIPQKGTLLLFAINVTRHDPQEKHACPEVDAKYLVRQGSYLHGVGCRKIRQH